MQPYLQAVTDSSIVIMVESDSPDPISVNFGTSSNSMNLSSKTIFYKTTENSTKTYLHRIYLNHLNPYTKYNYTISENGVNYLGNFTTASKDDATNFTFAIMGDCRSQVKIHSKIAENIIEKEPYFSIYLGDLCHSPTYSSWKDEFFIPSELKLIANVPFANAIGNHEDSKPNTYAFTQSNDINNKEDLGYFDFYYGPVHFIDLNTEIGISKNSKQYQFAKKTLENSKGKYKIVAMHIPAYCAGGHGDNENMIAITKELFETNDVDAVLAGHSHFYQHNLVNGIHHLIIAGGGAPLYTPKAKDYTLFTKKTYCYAIANYSDNKLTITVYDIDNKVLDTITVKK
jgi:predicted phosphodiesterase